MKNSKYLAIIAGILVVAVFGLGAFLLISGNGTNTTTPSTTTLPNGAKVPTSVEKILSKTDDPIIKQNIIAQSQVSISWYSFSSPLLTKISSGQEATQW